MANERIEIDIVLNDGSVARAFAQIPKAAQDASKKASGALSSIEGDFKKLGSGLSLVKSSFIGLGAAIGAGLAIQKISAFIGDAVGEAIQGEEALNNLANALRSAGDLSQENVDKFKAFANETQRTTKFADDQVLSLSALARNYARSSDQAIALTKAAIQLSAATGVDASTAIDQLGGTLNGVQGRLGKLVPGFKGLSEEALKSGAAIDLVNQRFGGSAESQVNTYAGSIAQLKNEFSDFLEGIGNLIIRSPALTSVLTEAGNIFREFSATVTGLTASNNDVLGPIIKQAIQFGLTINEFVIKPFEILANAVRVSFNIIKLNFDFAIARVGAFAGAIGKVITTLSSDNKIGQNLLAFSESSQEIFLKQAKATGQAFTNVLDTSVADGLETTLLRIGDAVNKASTKLLPEVKNLSNGVASNFSKLLGDGSKIAIDNGIQDIQNLKAEIYLLADEAKRLGQLPLIQPLAEQISSLPSKLQVASSTSIDELQNFKSQFQGVTQNVSASAAQMGDMIKNGLVNVLSSGIQSLVTSLINGENAFKAFAGSVLAIIGDLMIQLGTSIVLQGKAIEALKASLVGFFGGFAIAAGVALIAAGAALKAIASKGGKSAAPGSSITAPGTPATPVSGTANENISGDKRAQVNLTVQGNVYDPQGTGLAIADLLKSAGFDGALVV